MRRWTREARPQGPNLAGERAWGHGPVLGDASVREAGTTLPVEASANKRIIPAFQCNILHLNDAFALSLCPLVQLQ
jgi:hypothetical protein